MYKVSVIIPTFNGVKNVKNAVLSVINQDCYFDIEIIVVDANGDGKIKDQTYSVLKYFIDNKIIKYVSKNHRLNGSKARNIGFKNSKGKYLVFLDDDDFLLPNKIKLQFEQLESVENDYCASTTAGYYVRPDGKGYLKKIKYEKNFLYNYLVEENYFNTSALMISRSLFSLVNGFDESFNRHQDWEFFSRIFVESEVFYINDPLLIKYAENRNIPQNISKRIKQLDYFFYKISDVLRKELTDKEIKKVKKFKYSQVFIGFILDLKLIDGINFLKSKGFTNLECLISLFVFLKFVLNRIFFGGKKITYSRDELKLFLDKDYNYEDAN